MCLGGVLAANPFNFPISWNFLVLSSWLPPLELGAILFLRRPSLLCLLSFSSPTDRSFPSTVALRSRLLALSRRQLLSCCLLPVRDLDSSSSTHSFVLSFPFPFRQELVHSLTSFAATDVHCSLFIVHCSFFAVCVCRVAGLLLLHSTSLNCPCRSNWAFTLFCVTLWLSCASREIERSGTKTALLRYISLPPNQLFFSFRVSDVHGLGPDFILARHADFRRFR